MEQLDPWESPKERLLIVFLARTGSTWLCELMNKTNSMGYARESLHAQELINAFESGDYNNLNEIMRSSVKEHCTKNGIYSVKSTFHTLAPMFLLEEFPNNLERWKIVVLTRDDKLDQAISIMKLDKNRKSTSFDNSAITVVEEDYDYNEISRKLNLIMKGENTIFTFLQAYGANYLKISYENLSLNPKQIIDQISKFCGITVSNADIETQFEIQRDKISAKWKKQWLEDVQNENPLFSNNALFKR
ncbi:MAG: hypothetical protein HN820_00070 [Candidatus Marinimicrobia bacterium]|nr:hypothetical protein [Candidatus Neomarinimicrobiota bacterium]